MPGKTYIPGYLPSADMPDHAFHLRDHIYRAQGNLWMLQCKHPEYLICKSLPHHFYSTEIQNYFFKFIQPVADPSGLRPCYRFPGQTRFLYGNTCAYKSFVYICVHIKHL